MYKYFIYYLAFDTSFALLKLYMLWKQHCKQFACVTMLKKGDACFIALLWEEIAVPKRKWTRQPQLLSENPLKAKHKLSVLQLIAS